MPANAKYCVMNAVGGGGQKRKGIGVSIGVKRWHDNKRGISPYRYYANGSGA